MEVQFMEVVEWGDGSRGLGDGSRGTGVMEVQYMDWVADWGDGSSVHGLG